jgi:hypothetical protein
MRAGAPEPNAAYGDAIRRAASGRIDSRPHGDGNTGAPSHLRSEGPRSEGRRPKPQAPAVVVAIG